MPLNDNLKSHLKKMHDASATEGFTFANPKHPMVAPLLKDGYLIADHDTKDATDATKVAVAISDTGRAELSLAAPVADLVQEPGQEQPQAGQEGDETQTETKAGRGGPRGPRVAPVIHKSGVRIAIPEPVSRVIGSGGRGGEVYPFTSLQPPENDANGQPQCDSFFVAKTDNNPDPKKKLAGTISGANKRHKDEGRKFVAVEVENDHEFGKPGVRVLRTA
jgi:hypothetical protein